MWGKQRKITAAEVKALPEGTAVTLHRRDRHGYPTELKCTVVKTERSAALRYYDRTDGRVKRIPVRTLDNVVHYYTIEDKDSE